MVPKVCEIMTTLSVMADRFQWSPLPGLYTDMRHLRFANGPDEVHHMVVGRAEVQKYDLWRVSPHVCYRKPRFAGAFLGSRAQGLGVLGPGAVF